MDKTIVVQITDLTQNAKGVGHTDGLTIFVPHTLPGDEVLAKVTLEKKRYIEASMLKILTSSPQRRNLVDNFATDLSHASLLNFDFHAENIWKKNLLEQSLKRLAGIEYEAKLTYGEEFHYRNKVNLRLTDKGILALSERKSNRINPINSSLIFDKNINRLVEKWNEQAVKNTVLQRLLKKLKMLIIRTNRRGDCMLVIVSSPLLSTDREELFKSLSYLDTKVLATSEAESSQNAKFNFYRKMYYASNVKTLVEEINGLNFQISAESFLQVNNFTLDELYGKATKLFSDYENENILDLYCGIGISSLSLAKKAKKVIGVELVERAIKDAKQNAKANGISNVEFYAGKVENFISELLWKNQVNKVFLDPPRKGVEQKVLHCLIEKNVKEILYMSCNPATLARDLKILSAAGYKLNYLELINQFPNTTEVEAVVFMTNQ